MNEPDVTEQPESANAGCVQRVVRMQLVSVGKGCYHAVLDGETIFRVFPWNGMKCAIKWGACRQGHTVLIADARTKKEMLQKLTTILAA